MSKQTILILIGIALAILSAFIGGYHCAIYRHSEPPTIKIDTLVVYDTITRIEPIYYEKRVVERELVPMHITDTINVHDTTYIFLDREQVEWRDSLCTIWASGIHPQVDSVRHYTKQIYINTEITKVVPKKTHWGVGVQVGYGISVQNSQVKGTPYIGIGISYNLLTW